jgi:hypothetical protein
MLAPLAEVEHLVRQLEGRSILGAQQVEHPLPADHDDQAVIVAGALVGGPGARVGLVDPRRGVAVGCLKGGGSVGE